MSRDCCFQLITRIAGILIGNINAPITSANNRFPSEVSLFCPFFIYIGITQNRRKTTKYGVSQGYKTAYVGSVA
jgi:hypothetical protein